jgi:hypothetical protein
VQVQQSNNGQNPREFPCHNNIYIFLKLHNEAYSNIYTIGQSLDHFQYKAKGKKGGNLKGTIFFVL